MKTLERILEQTTRLANANEELADLARAGQQAERRRGWREGRDQAVTVIEQRAEEMKNIPIADAGRFLLEVAWLMRQWSPPVDEPAEPERKRGVK